MLYPMQDTHLYKKGEISKEVLEITFSCSKHGYLDFHAVLCFHGDQSQVCLSYVGNSMLCVTLDGLVAGHILVGWVV